MALACGCTSNTPGSPQPTGNAGSPTDSGSPASSSNQAEPGGAPKVKDPLDTTKWQQNPCSVLPAATLAQLGATSPGQPKKVRPGCDWFIQSTAANWDVTVQFVTDDPHGLSTVYDDRSDTSKFQPTTVSGYPAVIYRRQGDQQTDCSTAVGVTDKLYYEADVLSMPSGDPCSVAKTVATDALATMKSSG